MEIGGLPAGRRWLWDEARAAGYATAFVGLYGGLFGCAVHISTRTSEEGGGGVGADRSAVVRLAVSGCRNVLVTPPIPLPRCRFWNNTFDHLMPGKIQYSQGGRGSGVVNRAGRRTGIGAGMDYIL